MIKAIRLERDRRVLSIVERARGLKRLRCSFHDEQEDEVLGYKYPARSNENPCQENLTNYKSKRR